MDTKANYQMQILYLSKIILSTLVKTYRNFFWNKYPSNVSSNLVGWHRICELKCFGGFGLRKADVNNITLQLKLLLKLMKDNNSLRVKLVRNTYVKNSFLLSDKVSNLAS